MAAQIELSAGTVEYEDSGAIGPAIVLLHGLMMAVSSALSQPGPPSRLVVQVILDQEWSYRLQENPNVNGQGNKQQSDGPTVL